MRPWVFLLISSLAASAAAQTAPDMLHTKHNLSVSGPGPIRALNETRICVFCHTPHNATPLSPLWNKEIRPLSYTVYASPTLKAGPLPQPAGPTKLCLTCHDGTIAMGAVLNPAGGISMAGGDVTIPTSSLSNFGFDLSGHHPVSFPYSTALPNSELVSSPPSDLVFGESDELHCMTCHDPHDDTFGRFLAKDNRYSALCITCHQINGWSGSAHATSTASVVGILPRAPKTWPTYTQLSEWGCEVCHTPHFAPTAEELLNFTNTPPVFTCTSAGCHSSDPPPPHGAAAPGEVVNNQGGAPAQGAAVDIARQTRKPSAHHEPALGTPIRARVPSESAASGDRSAGCVDCHNPHLSRAGKADAPFVSGLLQGVNGVDRNGVEIRTATYEYEVCFKCHADNTPDLDYIPRVLTSTNTRLAFDDTNPSYHPVLSMGKNLNIPSLPSPLAPSINPSTLIYCTTCHADDEGSGRGPHGSAFPPILKERYETADNTPESYENYALCYRCHNRSSILADTSFRKKSMPGATSGGGHSGHLAAAAPCSACHDPHGVNDSGAAGPIGTGSHTHLINFDTRVVLPKTGNEHPIFTDSGTFSGSCTLVCHGVLHDNTTYP